MHEVDLKPVLMRLRMYFCCRALLFSCQPGCTVHLDQTHSPHKGGLFSTDSMESGGWSGNCTIVACTSSCPGLNILNCYSGPPS